jgi:hypothetical protein
MQRRTRFTTPLVRAAACAVFGLWTGPALLGQQAPPPAPMFGVRLYLGTERVDWPGEVGAPGQGTSSAPPFGIRVYPGFEGANRPAPPAGVTDQPHGVTPTGAGPVEGVDFEILRPPLPEAPAAQPPAVPPSSAKGIFRPAGAPRPARAKPASGTGTAGEGKGRGESQLGAGAGPGAPAAEGPRPDGRAAPPGPEPAWHDLLLKFALVQVLSVLAGLGLGCLLLAVALRRVLRRAERDRHSVLRVEVVNGLPVAYPGPAPAPAVPDAPEQLAPAAGGPGEGPDLPLTAEPFDLGPTYEEERRAREEAERLKEEALLRRLYEDNLRLRDELEQAEDGGHEAVPAAGQGPPDPPFPTYRYDEPGGAGSPHGGEEFGG